MEGKEGAKKEIQIQIQIKDYESLIQKHSWVAFSKIKKPTIYGIEDLHQEGVFVFLHARRSYKKDSPASFRTYLISSLRNHFCDLVQKSYRAVNQLTGFESNLLATIHSIANTDTVVTILSHHKENFKPIELQYITFLLNTPKRVQDKFRHCIGKRRQVIRRELQISPYKETEIRKSIKRKLSDCNV